MPKVLKAGYRWDSLEILWVDSVDHTEDQGGGVTMTQKIKCYGFRCACGKEFQVPIAEFIGVRSMRDCGCGDALGGGSGSLTVSLPLKAKALVMDYAGLKQVGKSQAFLELLRPGLRQFQAELKRQELELGQANERREQSEKENWL